MNAPENYSVITMGTIDEPSSVFMAFLLPFETALLLFGVFRLQWQVRSKQRTYRSDGSMKVKGVVPIPKGAPGSHPSRKEG